MLLYTIGIKKTIARSFFKTKVGQTEDSGREHFEHEN